MGEITEPIMLDKTGERMAAAIEKQNELLQSMSHQTSVKSMDFGDGNVVICSMTDAVSITDDDNGNVTIG